MNNLNSYIDKVSCIDKYVSWFSIGRIARKLSFAFSTRQPKMNEIAKKIDKLCDKEDRWPCKPIHAKERDMKALRTASDSDFVKIYRKTIVNTVEDIVSDICVSIFLLMDKYKKRFETDPLINDENRDKEYSETLEGKDKFSLCEFLVSGIHGIVHREKDTNAHNRIIDFEWILSFVFWLAKKLGVNYIEACISNRITYEILKAANSLKNNNK